MGGVGAELSWLTGGITGNITIAYSGQPPLAGLAADLTELSHVLRSELQLSSGDILFQVSHRAGSRNHQHVGRASKEPGERNLIYGRAVSLSHPVEWAAFAQATGREWKPRNESHSLALAIIHLGFPFTVAHVVTVLDRNDGNKGASALDVLSRNLGEPQMANEA